MEITETDRLMGDILQRMESKPYPFRADRAEIKGRKAWRFYYTNDSEPYEVCRILELDNGEPYVALRAVLWPNGTISHREKVAHFEALLRSPNVALPFADIHYREFGEL